MPRKPSDSLPHSTDCEKGLLCSYILNPHKVHEKCLIRGVTRKWFYHPAHAAIFDTLEEMKKEGLFDSVSKGEGLDHLLPITQFLADKGVLEEVGGTAEITNISIFVPTASNTVYYIDQLQEKAATRTGLLAAMSLTEQLKQRCSLQEVSDLLSGAFVEAKELCAVPECDKDYDKEAMLAFYDRMSEAAAGTNPIEFFPTGFPTFDDECGGMIRGELMLIRGRKGTGKSLTGQKIIAKNTLTTLQRKAAIYTYEMPYDQYMKRLVADLGSVSLTSMRNGRYSQSELNHFNEAVTTIMRSNLKIYDVKRLRKRTAAAFFASVRKHHKNHGLDMVMVDHLHLLQLSGAKSTKRTDEELHEFSKEFKAICLELNIAGILLAQEGAEGGTFGGTQVETDVDTSFSLTTIWKKINGINRIVGTDGAFCDKCRDGDLLGRKIPLRMTGQFARIEEGEAEKK